MSTLPEAPRGRYLLRYAVFLVGLFLMAIGIALSARSDLGTSPISTPPYVLSLTGTFTMGVFTIFMHALFVLIQIVLLRRDYEWIQTLQVVVGFAFGFFIDIAMLITSWAVPTAYWMSWLQLVIGCAVLALGVALQFVPRVLMNAGEGTVAVIARLTGLKIGTMKIVFDSTLVLIGVGLSFLLFGELRGVREGTIASAFLVGFFVGRIMPGVSRAFNRLVLVGRGSGAEADAVADAGAAGRARGATAPGIVLAAAAETEAEVPTVAGEPAAIWDWPHGHAEARPSEADAAESAKSSEAGADPERPRADGSPGASA